MGRSQIGINIISSDRFPFYQVVKIIEIISVLSENRKKVIGPTAWHFHKSCPVIIRKSFHYVAEGSASAAGIETYLFIRKQLVNLSRQHTFMSRILRIKHKVLYPMCLFKFISYSVRKISFSRKGINYKNMQHCIAPYLCLRKSFPTITRKLPIMMLKSEILYTSFDFFLLTGLVKLI